MKVRLKREWQGSKPGTVFDLFEAQALRLIDQGSAVSLDGTPSSKRVKKPARNKRVKSPDRAKSLGV